MRGDTRRIAALHTILWEPLYPSWQRQYAIDQLLIHDPQFKAKLADRIVLLKNWQVRQYVFDLAIERGWVDFTPTLVRAYAQTAYGMKDVERPERAAIEKLNPGKTIEQVIVEIFTSADSGYDDKQQMAAWALLNRISEPQTLIGLLEGRTESSPLVRDLKATAEQLRVLPRNREGVLWMRYLREDAGNSFWDSARNMVASIPPERLDRLELRHLPVLLQAGSDNLRRGRRELIERIEHRLSLAEHTYKGPTYDAPMSQHPQRFAAWRSDLAWADLVTIEVMLDLIEDREISRQLFAQADADIQDPTTEYGGVIDLADGRLVAQRYEPIARVHKWKYVPSQEMIHHLYKALAHYHFHAQHHHNGAHAGPGRGDLRLADSLRPNGLVFTFITPDKMNVDYYQPGKVVVDLGMIQR